MEKITGLVVVAGLFLSVAGAVMGYENIKNSGNLILLVIATVAGYRYLKFHATTPTSEFVGTCLEQKRFSTHYVITFRAGGAGKYSGRAAIKLGEQIKMGERARVKVKGPLIIEINKYK